MKKTTIEILSKAGWYPNRKIDITELIIYYEEKGFEMFPKAKKFLEEYGMLSVYSSIDPQIPEADIEKYGFDRLKLNTTNMTDSIVNGLMARDYTREYEEYVEENLVAVGFLNGGHATLMISESGKLFTEYGFFGNDAEEFWDRLLNYDLVTQWTQWDG